MIAIDEKRKHLKKGPPSDVLIVGCQIKLSKGARFDQARAAVFS